MATLVLLRHGQSAWNREKRFTGWANVDLSEQGVVEARRAGDLLKCLDCRFDACFTSYLARAEKTLEIVLAALDQPALAANRHWRLNERHYGALEGMRWWQSILQYGPRRMLRQRRFDVRPPALDAADPRHPGRDPLYAGVSPEVLPGAESMQDTLARLLPYWSGVIAPELRQGRQVLVVAHKNVLRMLLKHLAEVAGIDDHGVGKVRTGEPIICEFDDDKPLLRRIYTVNKTATLRQSPAPGKRIQAV